MHWDTPGTIRIGIVLCISLFSSALPRALDTVLRQRCQRASGGWEMTSLNVLPPSLASVRSKLCPATGDSDLLGGYGDRGSQNS